MPPTPPPPIAPSADVVVGCVCVCGFLRAHRCRRRRSRCTLHVYIKKLGQMCRTARTETECSGAFSSSIVAASRRDAY